MTDQTPLCLSYSGQKPGPHSHIHRTLSLLKHVGFHREWSDTPRDHRDVSRTSMAVVKLLLTHHEETHPAAVSSPVGSTWSTVEGDAALGLPDKDTHMRSSGPGPNPLSVVGWGVADRQDKTLGQVLGERWSFRQEGWVASGLGPMRMAPTPTGAFGSWLLAWWRLSREPWGGWQCSSQWEGTGCGCVLRVGGIPVGQPLLRFRGARLLSLGEEPHSEWSVPVCCADWGLTSPRGGCVPSKEMVVTKMLLLKIHWSRVITSPFLSEEAWQGRVPMCARREVDKRWRSTWPLSNSTLPSRWATKSSG